MENVLITIRVTKELRNRIDELARKNGTNKNHWIARTLTREAYKHSANVYKPIEHKKVYTSIVVNKETK